MTTFATTAPTVQASAALDAAFDALGTTPETWVSVTDSGDHVVGIFTTSARISGYRRALAVNTVRLSKLTRNVVSVEVCVREGAESAGQAIRDAALPAGTIVVTVERNGALVFADADTTLEPGDLVSALARPDETDAIRRKMEGGVNSDTRT